MAAIAVSRALFLMGFLLFLQETMADCPLNLSGSNFTLAASICSNPNERGKCCRHINAFVAVSVAQLANVTGELGVSSNLSNICLQSLFETMELYGVPRNATGFCGVGTKITVNYACRGRETVEQMLESPSFSNVSDSCELPLLEESVCRKCINAGILYLRNLIGREDNITLNTCRDATFVALASHLDTASVVDLATCFFGVQGLDKPPAPSLSFATPDIAPSPSAAASPGPTIPGVSDNKSHKRHSYHLTLVAGIGIAVTVSSILILVVLIVLIRRKNRELKDSDMADGKSSKFLPSRPVKKYQEGPSTFKKFSYKEIKKATDSFSTTIGQGGYGTVYKAQFSDDLVVAVKRMNKVSEQGEDEFGREIELLARLHHRHLVALRGFCVDKHERFLVYEYMTNGSLKDHLHGPGRTPLSWQTRIQIAIDVANALEYLHYYCDPPLCHRDIKSSNILLDENFVAKIADFGLAHASEGGSIFFEPVNTDICGTPGYMDPEYVITQELTEKSDIYSYGVLLLEIVTGRRAIQDGKNLVEWSQVYMVPDSRISELVDPRIKSCFDLEQLHTVVSIVRWCTEGEGRVRPSIKQVLRVLYESSDPVHQELVEAVDEEEEYGGSEGRQSMSRRKGHRSDVIFHSGEGRYLASSSSTTKSYCSRSFLLETGSPQSPPNIFSVTDQLF
ncbi:probable receptor-like protein kinase At1g49730 isoform X1 [Cucurbita pepo subsp. pepo]|uniref:probable receptor-like protein kinase At1g49730 isoform X1 n=1 Tax=Cucurbita pepo subsp. pepo TaxID=3664 RepID=UPI000C9D47D1|nr:probable receptor-like protein kinase At1g49730 isoform X1 [Cucurbita pepo subsp. pepo]